MRRIHIVGCGPRSGTTLLAEMMAACFEISHFKEYEVELFTPPPKDADIYLTKKPMDILFAPAALKVMRRLHMICLLRDPRDMVVSKHGEAPDQYWSGLKYWKTYTPFMEKARGHRRFLIVRYDDLVCDPDNVQAQIAAFMPFLKTAGPFSGYHQKAKPGEHSVKALKGFRPVSAGSIGNWKNHLPRLAGQLKQHGSIAEDLIRYGYEQDAHWEECLEGIEPDLAPSYRDEFFAEDFLNTKLTGQYLKAFRTGLKHGLSMLTG